MSNLITHRDYNSNNNSWSIKCIETLHYDYYIIQNKYRFLYTTV